jgi:uncharacterized protein
MPQVESGISGDRGARIRVPLAAVLAATLFVTGILSACADAPRPPPADAAAASPDFVRPPYFAVEGGRGAKLQLLGTIHIGPEEGFLLSPAIEADLAKADRLVLEVDLRLATEELVSDLLAKLVVLEPGTTLPEIVAPETVKLLDREDEALARYGFPRNARLRLKPWFVAVGIIETAFGESGWSTEAMVDRQVMNAFGARPILGLETVEEQLRLLDGLSPELQDLMLRDTVSRIDEIAPSLTELVTAWRVADERALERIAREGIDELPGLDRFYDVLLGERNRRWLAKLRPLLDDPSYAGENVFVAVGALHLVGQDSLVELLDEAGYRVARRAHDRPGVRRR